MTIMKYECKSCGNLLKSDIIRNFCPRCFSTSFYNISEITNTINPMSKETNTDPNYEKFGSGVISETNTETIQEAADKYYFSHFNGWDSDTIGHSGFHYESGFKDGAQWQSKQSYTPSEVNTMLEKLRERCVEAAELNWYGHTRSTIKIKTDKQSILSIDYNDLLNK